MITPGELNVLIVDDNDYALAMTSATLLELGVTQVSQAADGVEAFKLARTNKFDVVLLDWYMPEINGAGYIRLMREMDMEIPTIVTTAYATKDNQSRIQALGLSNILIKPFDGKKLARALSTALSDIRLSTKPAVSSPAPSANEGDSEEDIFLL